jgi:hypothetical protein
MDFLSLDVFFPDDVPVNSQLNVNLRDFGADDSFDGGDDTIVSTSISTPALESGEWIRINLDISGMANKSNLGQIILDADPQTNPLIGSTFYVDNIYLRR